MGVNKDSYLVLDKLPPEYDSRVKAMEAPPREKLIREQYQGSQMMVAVGHSSSEGFPVSVLWNSIMVASYTAVGG